MSGKHFETFKDTVERELMRHPVVTDNAYTAWFAEGRVPLDHLRHFTVQFSVFSNQFLLAALNRVINADTLAAARESKEILLNELGVIYADGGRAAKRRAYGERRTRGRRRACGEWRTCGQRRTCSRRRAGGERRAGGRRRRCARRRGAGRRRPRGRSRRGVDDGHRRRRHVPLPGPRTSSGCCGSAPPSVSGSPTSASAATATRAPCSSATSCSGSTAAATTTRRWARRSRSRTGPPPVSGRS